VLLDSNIIVYAARPENEFLRRLIAEAEPAVSVISKIETLGYHKLVAEERVFLEEFFDAALVFPVSDAIAEAAIRLRQQRRMALGDALIASTAIVHGLPLMTANVKDFDFLEALEVSNPFGGRLR
jgi:toxin FitB